MRRDETSADASSGGVRTAWLLHLERFLTLTAAVPLFVLVGVTVVDVFGRYLFGKPLSGGFELTEILLAVIVFASLPLVELHEEHITIDLLDRLYTRAAQYWRRLGIYALSGVAMGVVSWRLFAKARTSDVDSVTTAVLTIPIAPIAYFIASMCALSALVLCVKVVDQVTSAKWRHEVG